MNSAERPLRLLRLIVIVSIIDFLLLIPLVVGVIIDYHELAPIIGPIHGAGFLWELYLVARGAGEGWWGWWYPAVTLVTGGPPGALLGHHRARRQALERVDARRAAHAGESASRS
jgi:hypothetical protein